MRAWTEIGRPDSPILIVADHASGYVPLPIKLGIDGRLLETHIAVDIGVADLTTELCERLGCRAILGAASRLVVDLNRDEHDPAVIPIDSDGVMLQGNALTDVERQARLDTYWHPYHNRLAKIIAVQRPGLIVSLHSFTPNLAMAPDRPRPWDIGILYNDDDRAAQIAIPMLKHGGACVGDQEPYSGKFLNATMNRHAEANGIAYLGIEMRQDRIADAAGIAHWCERLTHVIIACCTALSRA